MDIIQAIQDLQAEKKRLDSAIAYLETLESGAAVRNPGPQRPKRRRRARGFEVSESMVQRWNRPGQ